MSDQNRVLIGTEKLKRGFAKMQKGGVVMDVTNADQAMIAENAGAVAVMALERVPADIRAAGGVARMSSADKIVEIIDSVTIPVMAKCRIGHFVEAEILQSLGVDMIDESEVLTPADDANHVNKHKFEVPFVCGCRDLGEALRRIEEGAAMIRTKGEAGTGDIIEAVRHIRSKRQQIAELKGMIELSDEIELIQKAREYRVSVDLVREVGTIGRLPVVDFAAGGISGPSDAVLCMKLGVDGVFVGSGIFKAADPETRAKAIVEATRHYDDPKIVADVCKGLGEPMRGIDAKSLTDDQKLQVRGI